MCPELGGVVGIYLHVPFCHYRCHYCDFLLFTAKERRIPRYVKTLIEDLKKSSKDYVVPSVFFGGGTPSMLSPEHVSSIVQTIKENYHLMPEAEITLESNPDTLTDEKLSGYLEAGVNRLSLGVQATQDDHLEKMGRRHRIADAEKAFLAARKAGFQNINLDGLFGLPDQTVNELEETLSILSSWNPEHLSIYGLQLEEGTRFYRQRERLNFPSEETQAEMLEFTVDFLVERGYRQYEISNFAKPGFESIHNQIYWNNEEYLGFGLGAVSYLAGERSWMTRNLSSYLSGKERIIGSERLPLNGQIGETIMLGLRQKQGISGEQFKRRFGHDLFEIHRTKIERLESMGMLTRQSDRLTLTRKGMLLASEVAKEFL